MATVTERQRRRRARLKTSGIVDATVTVPESRLPQLRAAAAALRADAPIGIRLLPAIAALKALREPLAEAGVRRAGVFGSVARGEDGPGSDVDVLLELDPARFGDALDWIEVSGWVERRIQQSLPGSQVDVADAGGMSDAVRARAEREAVYAF